MRCADVRIRATSQFLTFLMTIVTLAACGGGQPPEQTPAAGESTAAPPPAAAAALKGPYGVYVTNEVSGDLTSAFGFGEPARLDVPPLPDTKKALEIAGYRAAMLPAPRVPREQSMPRQEPGTRQRRGG